MKPEDSHDEGTQKMLNRGLPNLDFTQQLDPVPAFHQSSIYKDTNVNGNVITVACAHSSKR